MQRTRIKFCGVGRVEDARAASQCGADAIGMVFHAQSARCVSLDRAWEIMAASGPLVTPVGLFVDAPLDDVRHVAATLGLRHLQLHGDESPAYVESLRGFAILKAIRVARSTFVDELRQWREARRTEHFPLTGLVLETAGATGGSGAENDWQFIVDCQRGGHFDGLPPIIAAGGLTPQNVADVIRDVRPWAVDVSSGVESQRGIKSAEKLVAFTRAVRSADQRIYG